MLFTGTSEASEASEVDCLIAFTHCDDVSTNQSEKKNALLKINLMN